MKRPYSLIASSSSSSTPQNNYDVFLSFRGDTRNNFTSHLHKALRDKGIHTFLYDDGLERGRAISVELRKAIEGSRCAVVILSGGYASSRWCLDELVKILQCMKDLKQIVIPIFYHVDPSHVRKQIGSIGEAFQRHEQDFGHDLPKVKTWRTAFTEVGNLAGCHLQDYGNEAKFIEDFIKVVSSKLDVALLNISKDLVGMDSRLEELKLCVSRSPFEDVRFIGICGMGASSFLANIREVCEKENNGLLKLQKQLLTDILKGEHTINNVYEGIGMIRTRLCSKKVLVILDDVDQLKQLEGLAEKNNWFGYGSRIILTTRDESLLTSMYGEEEYILHNVDKLKYSEALRLFSSKAFKSDCPPEDYRELSEKVLKYANGLPLALVLLGSFLRRKSINEWRSALDRLKEYPKEEIMKVLQISFDGLEETEKKIFLDIACFFNGSPKNDIMKIMDSCGFFPEIGIRSLVDKSLLQMDHNDKLRMHDLLEEMGKEIIRKESRYEPGNNPSWLTHQFRGSSSISLPLHPNWCTDKWMGFALSVCFSYKWLKYGYILFWQIKINQEDWGFGPVYYLPPNNKVVMERRWQRTSHYLTKNWIADNHLWLLYLPRDIYFHTEWHNKSGHIQFSFQSILGEKIEEPKQCSVRLVYEQDIEELSLTARRKPIEEEPRRTRLKCF
ncbi:hypothetical protein FNV43_RR00831 [Rhamnella rubrinervis]|uniref:ADP-ribosyl cyclase/cyclic ADP-ribose hydrolase n=1 Tax=Rhamnella rubrinervis TaxID=2594499 RepID=A0A8K0HNI4_9ROSA|nr:hypothetical protein FNV43_RR00831 [Rhamnella rubrinervis]